MKLPLRLQILLEMFMDRGFGLRVCLYTKPSVASVRPPIQLFGPYQNFGSQVLSSFKIKPQDTQRALSCYYFCILQLSLYSPSHS